MMMDNDRELLMLAAKAANIETQGYCTNGYMFIGDCEKGSFDRWNPLTNDGDALRLAVKLRLVVATGSLSCEVRYNIEDAEQYELDEITEPCHSDPYTAPPAEPSPEPPPKLAVKERIDMSINDDAMDDLARLPDPDCMHLSSVNDPIGSGSSWKFPAMRKMLHRAEAAERQRDELLSALLAAVEWGAPMSDAPKSSRPEWFDLARKAIANAKGA